MATLKLMIDYRNKETNSFPVVLRITHRNQTKYIQTGYKIRPEEWNEKELKVQKPFSNSGRANAVISMKKAIAEKFITEISKPTLKTVSVFELVTRIEELIKETEESGLEQNAESRTSLFEYGAKEVLRLKKAKKDGNAIAVEGALNSFRNYMEQKDLYITDITLKLLKDYEAYYEGRGKTGYAPYLRAIRAIYNSAIKDEKTEVSKATYPFGSGGYSIKTKKTKKRAISDSVIKAIRELDLKEDTPIWHHRNLWLFMFNMRGMNFIDIAFLKCDSIKGKRLVYSRKKTKAEFNIAINEEASKILDIYSGAQRVGNLVFPVMEQLINIPDSYQLRKKYKEKLKLHNQYLKRICTKLKEDKEIEVDNLTTYVARHSFATIGVRKGLSKAMIGDMLGHADYNVTETYLASFEHETLDEAAEAIFK